MMELTAHKTVEIDVAHLDTIYVMAFLGSLLMFQKIKPNAMAAILHENGFTDQKILDAMKTVKALTDEEARRRFTAITGKAPSEADAFQVQPSVKQPPVELGKVVQPPEGDPYADQKGDVTVAKRDLAIALSVACTHKEETVKILGRDGSDLIEAWGVGISPSAASEVMHRLIDTVSLAK